MSKIETKLEFDHIKNEVEMRNNIFLILIISLFYFSCSENPTVVVVTSMGDIEIELNANEAPKHTANFMQLVK